MRKITRDAIVAFITGECFYRDNTIVESNDNVSILRLHGNEIATRCNKTGVITVSDGGYQSNTTKERLNGIPNVTVHQKKFKWFLNGIEWSGRAAMISFDGVWHYTD